MNVQECLIYVSTAAIELGLDDVASILARSEHLNQLDGVSGMLLYSEGTFMQFIEGPSSGVDSTYARIRKSSKHHGIIELFRRPVQSRHFRAWDWAYALHGVRTYSSPQAQTYLADNGTLDAGAAPAVEQKILGDFWSGREKSSRCWCLA
jgi:hypothetical protein